MRRVYAIILLIPVMAMFAGVLMAASYCARAAGADCSVMGKMDVMAKMRENSMKAASPPYCEGRVDGCGQSCHQGQKGKSEQKGKDGGGCCIDCPLCSLVTFKSLFRLEVAWQVTIIDYTVMPENNLSDYFQQHWKPPNVSSIS